MSRPSAIEKDGKEEEVLKLILDNVPIYQIAERLGYDKNTVYSFVKKRLYRNVAIGGIAAKKRLTQDFMSTLSYLQGINEKLIDACDEWLRKPHSKKYSLGPRADEIDVIYEELVKADNGKFTWKKNSSSLQTLLDDVFRFQTGMDEESESKKRKIDKVNYKHADPRMMIVAALAEARKQSELIAKVTGELKEIAGAVDIYGVIIPQMLEAVNEATADNPDARERIVGAISRNFSFVDGGETA